MIVKNRKGITSLIAFLIAILIIVLIFIPLYFLITGYSNPQYKGNIENNFPSYQINSGQVIIYFASTYYKSSSTSCLISNETNPNYVLKSVYVIYNGTFANVTSAIRVVPPRQPGVPAPPPNLPSKMIYNFTLPDVYTIKNVKIPLWNSTLILQIEAYNQTIFLTALPNETAIVS